MKKELKDYLHLYLGCVGFGSSGCAICLTAESLTLILKGEVKFTPILRPLSDMTKEEMKELYLIVFNRKFLGDNITHRDIGKKNERWVLWSGVERLFIYSDGDVGADSDLSHYRVHMPTVILWFLSKHFDLFGLIDAGLAIDATEIKKTVQ